MSAQIIPFPVKHQGAKISPADAALNGLVEAIRVRVEARGGKLEVEKCAEDIERIRLLLADARPIAVQ